MDVAHAEKVTNRKRSTEKEVCFQICEWRVTFSLYGEVIELIFFQLPRPMVFKSRARPKFLVRGVRESALFSVDWETERQQHGKLSTSYQFDVKKK